MKTNLTYSTVVLAALTLLSIGNAANAQYVFFPNDATISTTIDTGGPVVGYANNTDRNNRTNGTSPTINLVTGGDIQSRVAMYDQSKFNVHDGIFIGLDAYDNSQFSMSGGRGGGLFMHDNASANITGGTLGS